MINKIARSVADAMTGIPEGATVLIGGFGTAGIPNEFIAGLIASKIVEHCTYPLTGIGCVKRVYPDIATLECTPSGLKLIDKVEGLAHAELEKLVGLPIAA